MGRPREFEETEVLGRALQTFWARGYEATSVQDLVDATGLSRASLYGAFGDKEALFGKALDLYRAQAQALGAELATGPSAREALERYLLRSVDAFCARPDARGCFLQVCASESQPAMPLVARAFAEVTAATDAALLACVRRGKRSGEFSRALDEKAAARFLGVLLQGLSTAARTGRGADELRAAARLALSALG